MEEQNKAKQVKMKEGQNSSPKYSYDELRQIADSLFNENKYLKHELQQAQAYIGTVNRLEYLFRIVECDHNNKNNSVSFDSDFVEKCIDEIQKIMDTPADEKKEDKEN